MTTTAPPVASRQSPVDPAPDSRLATADSRSTSQLTFTHLEAQQAHETGRVRPPLRRWREAEHARARETADRASQIRDPAKERAADVMIQLLREWLRGLRVDDQVAAIDFVAWMDNTGVRASVAALDPRTQGSLAMRTAVQGGWLIDHGMAPNGGSDKSNSSPRRVYRVVRVPGPASDAAGLGSGVSGLGSEISDLKSSPAP